MKPVDKSSLFRPSKDTSQFQKGLSKHQVDEALKVKENKSKSSDPWFIKESDLEGISDVLAQEFFRLIIPTHPKTRLHVLKNDKFLVTSKAIPNFKTCYEINKNREQWFIDALVNGQLKDLGKVTLVALFIGENDLKPENIGVADNHFVKIDGDQCFCRLNTSLGFKIMSATDIQSLPMVIDFKPHNWLESRRNNEDIKKKPTIFNENMRTPEFVEDVNEAILSILVLPDNFFRKFVSYYMEGLDTRLVDIFSNHFIQLKSNLFKAAMQNKEFIDYVKSDRAQIFLTSYIKQLNDFIPTGKNSLIDDKSSFDKDIKAEFNLVKNPAIPAHLLNMIPPDLLAKMGSVQKKRVNSGDDPSSEGVAKRQKK